MCSASSLLRHFGARQRASGPRVRRQGRERTASLCCPELVTLPALGALIFLAGAALAQGQESSTPILSSGLHRVAPAQTQAIENRSQRPAAESVFDVANMPPIESIGAETDIRPFMALGVPEDLTRAALRRAWSADPVIRDFIGLSENSGDFNAPDGVPQFASPTLDAVRQPLAGATKETESLDSQQPAAERLAHGQIPVLSGEVLPVPSRAQRR